MNNLAFCVPVTPLETDADAGELFFRWRRSLLVCFCVHPPQKKQQQQQTSINNDSVSHLLWGNCLSEHISVMPTTLVSINVCSTCSMWTVHSSVGVRRKITKSQIITSVSRVQKTQLVYLNLRNVTSECWLTGTAVPRQDLKSPAKTWSHRF